jgi:hypothetical protein
MSVTVGTTTVPLTYDFTGYPTVTFPASITLGTGGAMTFHGGNGASVPTFDVAAIIPGLGVMTLPVPAADGGATIVDTSQDLSVTWMPISIGLINFTLLGAQQSAVSNPIDEVEYSIQCAFDGASGSGVVPQALLSAVKEMAGSLQMYADLSSELDAATTVDGLTIVTRSFQTASDPATGFEVTLQ